MHETRPSEPQHSPRGYQLTAALRENILDPLRLASIRQRNEEMIITAENDDGRAVLTMGLSSDVDDNRHARYWKSSEDRALKTSSELARFASEVLLQEVLAEIS